METISINTTQNVNIDYPVAGIGDRCLAFLIDTLIAVAYSIAISQFFDLAEALAGIQDLTMNATINLLLYLPVFFYHLVLELIMGGQSVGKRLMKIKVVKLDNSQPGFIDYFLRWILRIVDITVTGGGAAIFTIMFNGKGQRLGDLAAGTTVVKIKPEATLADTILKALPENYQPSFSQVTSLTDGDIDIVKRVLELEIENPKIGAHLTFKTKNAVSEKMGVKSELMPGTFLEKVLDDYNFYLQQ